MKELIFILALVGLLAYGLWPLALVLLVLYLWF
jgi:uncharacterized membrane protein YpjA